MQEISFIPSPDVAAVLNSLLDRLENRSRRTSALPDGASQPGALGNRAIKIRLADLDLPGYFSQTDPEPRLTANQQFQDLAQRDLLGLAWLPGETGHLLEAVSLKAGDALYLVLGREPLAERRSRLEMLLLGEQFRFPEGDWRRQVVRHAVEQVRAGKSASPFSLTDMALNQDLLAVLLALPALEEETPYRVFSVRLFNDSKRFDALKPALVRLARQGCSRWKSLPGDELLRELNLVANPGYIHLSGNWQLTTRSGELLSLGGFAPSVGFPAAQTAHLQSAAVHAKAVCCIENLTTFHDFARKQQAHPGEMAAVCILGNPSPSIRHLLRFLPAQVPLLLWADLDYGGFNILSQMRQYIHPGIQPCFMDIATFDAHAHLARPLTQTDARNLKRLAARPELQDTRPVMLHLVQRGLKLEQEAI